IDIQAVVIKGGEGGYGAYHDRHGVSPAWKAAIHELQLFMYHRMERNGTIEARFLLCGRQFAVEQQIADFHKVAIFSEAFDIVAAITQDSLVAVDIRNGRFTGSGGEEAGIVGEIAGLSIEFADVYYI